MWFAFAYYLVDSGNRLPCNQRIHQLTRVMGCCDASRLFGHYWPLADSTFAQLLLGKEVGLSLDFRFPPLPFITTCDNKFR